MYTTMNGKPSIYEPESLQKQNADQSLVGRLKNNPLLAFALVGFTGIVGYRFRQIRQDRAAGVKTRLSLQLIHTRLMAQGFVIGTLSLTVCYLLGKRAYESITGVKLDQPTERRN